MLPSPHALVANLQDAIVLVDGRGQVLFESPAAAAILGARTDGVLAPFALDRVHDDDRESVVRAFERTIAVPGSVARATYRFGRAGGGWRHLEAVAKNLLDDPELGGVLITFRDVTERIEALETARRAGAARDEFLARMGHEMRTPLHAVLGWAEILAPSRDPVSREAAGQIEEAGRLLLKLVEESMDLAAVHEGRIPLDPRPLDVAAAIRDAAELIRPLAERREVLVRASVPAGCGSVRADPDRLRQVLLNLLGNAVKFGPPGAEVRVDATRTRGAVRIDVADEGPGIPPRDLDRLFERYVRLETAAPGHGLGLAIVRRLVELMEGKVGVESVAGRGATFWIELPAADPASASPGSAAASVVGVGSEGYHSGPRPRQRKPGAT